MEATATAAPVAAPDALYTCEVCGKTFDKQQALGGHMSAAHRSPDAKPLGGAGAQRGKQLKQAARHADDVIGASLQAQVDAQVAELVASLRQQLKHATTAVEQAEAVTRKARADRSYIEAMLRKLDPTTAKTSTRAESLRAVAAQVHGPKNQAKRDNVLAIMSSTDESLTGDTIVARMRDAGMEPPTSGDKVRKILKELHSEGVIRADKVVRGGGMTYKLLASPTRNGDTHGT